MYFNKIEFKQEGIRRYVVDGVKENNSYYILMSETILRMDLYEDTPKVIWKKKMKCESRDSLTLLQDKVIFDICEGGKNKLEAVDKETGEHLWCYEAGERFRAASDEKYIFLSPLFTDEIHIIKSSDGALLQKIRVEDIQKEWEAKIEEVVVYQGECYCVFSSKKGLILTHIYINDGIFAGKILHTFNDMGDVNDITTNGNWLICRSDSRKGYDTLLAFNLDTMQTEAQMKLPEEWYKEIWKWRPASKHNPLEYIAVFEKDFGGIAYIDLKQEEIRWYQGGKGRWDVWDACFSQGRVMAIARGVGISEDKDGGPKFVEINPISGEWNSVSNARLCGVFGFEDFLIAEGFPSFTVYQWSEVEATEATMCEVTETKIQAASEQSGNTSNSNLETKSQTSSKAPVNTEDSWNGKIERLIADNDLVELEKFYIQGTGVTKIAPQVMKFLKSVSLGEKIKGPIYFATLLELFRLAPEDSSWPGSHPVTEAIPVLYLGSETYGHYFYLMPESGMVLCMHHDDVRSRISEIVERSQVNGRLEIPLFCKSLEKAYGLCKLDQLLKLQKSLEDYKQFTDIPQSLLIRRTSQALKDSLTKLKKAVSYIAYQFLMLEEEVISALILFEKHSILAKENPEEVRSFYAPYLEGTSLSEEILACKGLEELDLSYNPQLDFQVVFEQLEQLPNLKRLVLKENQLTTLPEGIIKLKNLREILLSNNLIEHPFNLKLTNTLKFLDLRKNPVEEAEATKLRAILTDTRISTDFDGWESNYPKWQEPYQEIEWIRFLPDKNLEELEALKMTEVKKIEPEISKCRKLKYIEFWGEIDKKLLEFSDSLCACESLETLSFRKQEDLTYEDVIPKLKPLKNLKRLVLEYFSGKNFPNELVELSSLEELEIKFSEHIFISFEQKENKYCQITDEAGIESFYEQCYQILGKAKQLRKLILRRPGSKTIPKDFGRELQLEELVLDFHDSDISDWSTVFHTISNIETLKRLEVYSSKCREIPVEFGQLKNLEYLKLFCNYEIADWNQAFEVISGLTGLQYLDLYGSKFTYFPDCMKRLTNLNEFHVDAEADLESLFRVCAAHPKLEYLSFDQRYFDGQVHIPENIGALKTLKVLNFYRNPAIKSFPKSMSQLINLEWLNVKLCGITKEQQQELIGMLPYCQVLAGDDW